MTTRPYLDERDPLLPEGDGVVSQHNHVTRDIKPFGACPACDRYYACTCRNGPRVYPDAPPAHDVSCWYPARTPR